MKHREQPSHGRVCNAPAGSTGDMRRTGPDSVDALADYCPGSSHTEAELDYYQQLPQRGVSEPLLLDPECWALKRQCGTRKV